MIGGLLLVADVTVTVIATALAAPAAMGAAGTEVTATGSAIVTVATGLGNVTETVKSATGSGTGTRKAEGAAVRSGAGALPLRSVGMIVLGPHRLLRMGRRMTTGLRRLHMIIESISAPLSVTRPLAKFRSHMS
jgi:hypothetical protein